MWPSMSPAAAARSPPRRASRGGRVRAAGEEPGPRPRWISGTWGDLRWVDEARAVRVPAVVLGQGRAPGYAVQGQEAFLEGHVPAFEWLAAVPLAQIRYDNLRPRWRVLAGRSRTETARWLSFRSCYKSVPAGSLADCSPGLLLAAG